MKHSKFRLLVIALMLSTGISVTSCKSKSKDTTNDNTTTSPSTTAPAPAPVEISGDDALRGSAQDAIKDYPGVTATVNNGEITLTGNLKRSKLPDLMQRLNALHPKKINNNLKLN